jgi:hypothetical protein
MRQAPFAASQYSPAARHPLVTHVAVDRVEPQVCTAVLQLSPSAHGIPSAQPTTQAFVAASQYMPPGQKPSGAQLGGGRKQVPLVQIAPGSQSAVVAHPEMHCADVPLQ